MATEGTFVLADIGGYTTFLSEVGLRHGKEITEHLLNRLVKTKHPRWKVGNVMGDCVFFYGDPEAPADTFGRVRALYESFKDAKMDIASGSTCRCGACDRSEDLSLKFVVHRGEYDVQNIGGRKELIGQDIVLATRLLKNSVPVKEYVIATEAAGGVADASGVDAAPAEEHLDGIGPVAYRYIDLGPVAAEYERARGFHLSASDSRLTFTEEIEAPVETVFAAMTDMEKRAVWQVTVKQMMHIQGRPGKVGEVHSCLHGDGTKVVHLTIAVDPEGHRMTERIWITPPIMKDTYVTTEATPLPDGRTRAALYATFRPRYPVLSHLALPLFMRIMKSDIRKDMAGLKELCETGTVAGREPATARTDS